MALEVHQEAHLGVHQEKLLVARVAEVNRLSQMIQRMTKRVLI